MCHVFSGSVDFFHGGSMFSYNSVVVVDLITKTGIAVTVNGLNPTILELDLYPLAYYLKDLLLDKTPWLNETTICSYPEPWGNPAFRPLPTQNVLEKYVGETGEFVGVFGHTLYGEVLVTENNQSIDLKWGEVMKGTLYDRRNLSFRLRVDDDVFSVLGKEIGVIKVVFNQFYSGQYNNIEITFQGMMETYTFSRDVEFNFFLPSKSTSSSTARLNSFTTEFCPFVLLFILVNLFFPLWHLNVSVCQWLGWEQESTVLQSTGPLVWWWFSWGHKVGGYPGAPWGTVRYNEPVPVTSIKASTWTLFSLHTHISIRQTFYIYTSLSLLCMYM